MSRQHVFGSTPEPNGLHLRPQALPSHSATPAHLAIADWLIASEKGDDGELLVVAESARRVSQKLSQRIAELITPAACEALLSRALHLTRADFPFLGCAHRGHTAAEFDACLGERTAAVESNLAREGCSALFGTLIGLLALFISEDLTFRLLGGLWPELPLPRTMTKADDVRTRVNEGEAKG
jgi:hypothetical protein